MDYIQLEETLKFLNGFEDDLSKINEIINYVKENGRISVFAYGSLLWNPIKHFNKFISNCILNNYKKGFFCKDFVYRGTHHFQGLTMGLQKDTNGFVNGGLLVSTGDYIIPFIKSFILRETPIDYNGISMDIYKYDFVKIILPDRINCEYALTCIVNIKSEFYLNKQLRIEEQAHRIGQASGLNGTNFQYLEKLKNIYEELNIEDSFSTDFDNLYNKIVSYRFSLTINLQKWFQIYVKLQSLEQTNKQNSIEFVTLAQSDLSDLIHFEERNSQGEQI